MNCKFNKRIPFILYISYFCGSVVKTIPMTETQTDWYIIVNPHAGSGKTVSEWPEAVRLLDENSISYTTVFTDRKHHATDLAAQAASQGYRNILAVGGDGSVHEIFCGVLSWCEKTGTDSSEFTIGVIPIGSGNDWIRSHGIPCDKKPIISAMAAGKRGVEDVVRVTAADGAVCYMANIGGAGFDSLVCDRVNRQKERGYRNRLIYVYALLRTVCTLKPMNIGIRADGKDFFSGKAYSVALGNGRYSGSGMCQVPLASFDDGMVDMMVVPKVGLGRILKEMPRLFNETMNESETVLMARASQIEIFPLDAASAAIFEVDGEIEGCLPMRIECTGAKIGVVKI